METLKKITKKPIAWILVCALVLTGAVAVWHFAGGQDLNSAIVGTGGDNQLADNQGSGFPAPVVPEIGKTPIAKPLTWEGIQAIPVKTSDMTVDQMRQLCVDFYNFSKTALWTPKESFTYFTANPADKEAGYQTSDPIQTMQANFVYGGLPYVTMGTGNVYRLMDYMDETTGVVDVRKCLAGSKDLNQILMINQLAFFGNQCSVSAYWGWGRVINSVYGGWTNNMVPTSGIIILGSYGDTLDGVIQNLKNWNNPDAVGAAAGTYNTVKLFNELKSELGETAAAQRVYENYALARKADGLVNYTTGGHVMMCADNAHIVRNGDGTINPTSSYILVSDQAGGWTPSGADQEDYYMYVPNVNKQMTFDYLYKNHYVPFTFKEFHGQDDVEETTYGFSHTGSTITKSQLFASTVNSNYGISDVYAIITDASGKEVYRHIVRTENPCSTELHIYETEAEDVNYKGEDAKTVGIFTEGTFPTASGNYNIEIVAQLSTGERPTLYIGTLAV